MLLALAHEEQFIARKASDRESYFVAALQDDGQATEKEKRRSRSLTHPRFARMGSG
jgi:hypothetical protein